MRKQSAAGSRRYEFRHFIIFGPASEFAAMATECAGDQGAWWEFHDAYLLRGQARLFARVGATELARDEGLDVDRFLTCIDNDEHGDRILQMQQQAIADGVSATPTFRINGQRGARSLDAIMNQAHAAAEAAQREGS